MCVSRLRIIRMIMFFVVRSNDIFNFPHGWIKYIVIVVSVYAIGLYKLSANGQFFVVAHGVSRFVTDDSNQLYQALLL